MLNFFLAILSTIAKATVLVGANLPSEMSTSMSGESDSARVTYLRKSDGLDVFIAGMSRIMVCSW